jgi:hypothetical protein
VRLKSHKYQLLQHVTAQDKEFTTQFAMTFYLSLKMMDLLFTAKIVFSDEATLHPSGHVYSHDIKIWHSNNLHTVTEGKRDSTKYTVFCDPYQK